MKKRKSMFFKATAVVIAFSMLIPASAFAEEASAEVSFEAETNGAVETETTETDELVIETEIQNQSSETESLSEVTDDSENEQTEDVQECEESISADENEEITQDLTADDNDQDKLDETVVIDELSSIDMTTDGWKSEGDDWYYVRNGELVEEEIINYNGNLYYLDWNGVMIKGTTYGYWDSESEQSVYIRAYDNGQLVTGWYEEVSTWGDSWWYYYGTDGKAVSGVQTIDGVTYYFYNDGQKATNTTYTDTEKGIYYIIGDNGVLSAQIDLTTDGWKSAGDDWYYVKDGALVENEIINYNGKLYYLDWNGAMIKGTTSGYWDSEAGRYVYVRANSNGQLVTGWYEEVSTWGDSWWYYYGTDGKAVSGVQTIDGVTYYFYNDGQKATNTTYTDTEKGIYYIIGDNGVLSAQIDLTTDGWKSVGDDWYYVKDGALVKDEIINYNGKLYYLNWNGVMIKGTTSGYWDSESDRYVYVRAYDNGQLVKGWYEEVSSWGYSSWYYYGADGKAVSGVQTVNGKTYYFYDYGEMARNTTAVADGILYIFGDDGTVTAEIDMTTDGWKSAGDDWYYVKNGELVKKEIINYNGNLYFMNYEGVMIKDQPYGYYDSESGQYVYIRANSNGQLVKGWCYYYTSWYYYDVDGKSVSGIFEVNGKKYGFEPDGRLLYNTVINSNGTLYYVNSDGLVSASVTVPENGWVKFNDNWYYSEEYNLITSELRVIGNYTYYFDSEGKMAAGTVEYYCGNNYAFDDNGHMVTGWYRSYGGYYSDWMYFNADGSAADGLMTINGKDYFFNNGSLVYDREFNYNGKIYKSDVNGLCTEITANGSYGSFNKFLLENGALATGWRLVSGKWYYYDSDGYATGIRAIGDNIYYFNSEGEMLKGWIDLGTSFTSAYRYLYAENSGALKTDGWLKLGDSWYYFSDNYMVTGLEQIDGSWNLFGSSGAWQRKLDSNSSGWIYDGQYYYYLSDGQIISGCTKAVNGNIYGFDYSGKMLNDSYSYGYYFGTNGAAVKNSWAQISATGWIYTDENGKAVDGWKYINGSWYYFENNMAVNYDKVIDGKLYKFDEKSYKMVTNGTSVSDGWLMVDGKWYYFENGEACTGIKKIGSATYYLDPYMMTDRYYYSYDSVNSRYFDANGKQLESGWSSDGTIYATGNGKLADGLLSINGKEYYFSYGYLQYGIIVSDDSTVIYETDENGAITDTVKASGTRWYKSSYGSWYYFINGKVAEGLHSIDGKLYYFSPYMVTDQWTGSGYAGSNGVISSTQFIDDRYMDNGTYARGAVTYNGKYYYFCSNGSYYGESAGISNYRGLVNINGVYYFYDGAGSRTAVTLTNGWNKVDGKYYYYENGRLVTGDSKCINGKYYWFNVNGQMVTDSFMYDRGNYVYVDSNGYITTGWKKIDGIWYYFGSDGHAYIGTHVIDGVSYTFVSPVVYSYSGVG